MRAREPMQGAVRHRETRVILDGEVAVFDERLVSRFDLLSEPDATVLATPPVYVAFDVLYALRQDLRARPSVSGPRRSVVKT